MTHEELRGTDKPSQRNLDNLQDIQEILVDGTEEELEALRVHAQTKTETPITKEMMALYRAHAQQRHRLIQQSDADAKEREAKNPLATELERRIGTYKELLEPPVREAVFKLREKGYSSFESGFAGSNKQYIGFEFPIPELVGYEFSGKIQAEAQRLGAELLTHIDRVSFTMTRVISDEDLTYLWNLIADELPSLNSPQPDTQVKSAQIFREKQEKLVSRVTK